MENASREYTHKKVKSHIERQKSKYGWEFIFLGADIDAVDVADRVGITRNRAQNFHKDKEGIELHYRVVSDAVASFRKAPKGVPLTDSWSAEIDADYERRKRK